MSMRVKGFNILVSAAALRTSGARTIYRQFLEHLKTRVDGNRYYIMVDKGMEMPIIDGVEYLVVDVSSKIKRLVFDAFGFDVLMKRSQLQPDFIVSLQNIGLRKYKQLPQIVYYHNPLPFFEYNWNIFRKGELMMLLYKHLYPFFVKRSVNAHTEMVVQLPFIKKGVVSTYGMSPDKVHMLFPDLESINISDVTGYDYDGATINFVFPATCVPYKGHDFLVSVMSSLCSKNKAIADKVRIHLTLHEESSRHLIESMEAKGVRQNFVFHGVVEHDTLLSMYKGAAGLLFPSVIETLGLPLVEAATFGLPIIACDLEYAHEVLTDYSGGVFVASRSAERWADAMMKVGMEQKRYPPLQARERSSWEQFFDFIENKKLGDK